MNSWVRRGALTALVIAILVAAGMAYYRYQYPLGWTRYYYPYGQSHCCDKQLMMALLEYAERHGGWFPQGEETPEASLSLLHREAPESADANLLRGKTV